MPMLDDLSQLTPTLRSLGWTTAHDEWADSVSSDRQIARGRIARVSRGYSVVFTGGDAILAASASIRSNTGTAPATGDYVVVEDDPDDGPSLAAIADRHTALNRRAAGRYPEAQVLAANIDHVFVMDSLDREVSLRRIERQLVIAWDSGATPTVVLTKADQVADYEQKVTEVAAVAPGVDTIAISSVQGTGMDQIRSRIQPGITVALMGLSGIGKSTLVNELTDGHVQRTGEVRATDRRGRHTTVTRDLIPLPGLVADSDDTQDGTQNGNQNGTEPSFIIDTPGIREIGLWQAYDGMAKAFPEIAGDADRCRFADCQHESEPGCAIQQALADQTIAPRRLQHWNDLMADLALQQEQLEEFARRSESRDRADVERKQRGERRSKKNNATGKRRSR